MLSQIYFVPEQENINGQSWKLGHSLGHGFETHIKNVLAHALEPLYDSGVRIESTPSSRDDGKDIIIESRVDLEDLMGFHFPLGGKENIRIYIECKSSDSGNISYNQIAGNVARIKNDSVDYYVLITNTTVAPYSYYQFKEELRRLGIAFLLMDQYLLGNYLKEKNAEIGIYTPHTNAKTFHAAYQFLSAFQEGKPIYKLYLMLRNYQGKDVSVQLKVNTDRNWNISQKTVKQVLAPFTAQCLELVITKEYYDGMDELILSIDVQNREIFTKLKGLNWENSFIPPLCGRHHQEIIDALVKNALTTNQYHFFYLWGEAGVGKTRIMDEMMTRIQGRNVETAIFKCTNSDTNLRQKIKDYLIKKAFLSSDVGEGTLCELLSQIDTSFQKLLLVIDDLHNADSALLDEIKQTLVLSLDKPITLLVVGRNDYSEGALEYYALVQKCVDTYRNRGWVLEALGEEDAKQFIRLIVQDIPEFALQKIYDLSNRVPLFIVETIEYLLDLKLVNIVNRSSVGIQNPENFNSHLDVPKRIEDIYARRFENLGQLPNGAYLKDFLMACTLLSSSFSFEVASAYFDNPTEDVKELFHRRFLRLGNNGDWQYNHESLYLFLKKLVANSKDLRKKCADLVIDMPTIFRSLTLLQKGRVCLWSENRDESSVYFQPIIQDISNIQNHSNINLDHSYNEYLEDVYECVSAPEMQEKVILSKIYIALHYYTPYIAIQQCQWAREKLSKSKALKNRMDLNWMLREHEAHCYLNAGQLKCADLLLHDLLAATVYNPGCVDSPTLFDLYDKLSNLYIKYNNKETALKYILLAEKTAKESMDSSLESLAYITHGKLFFFMDYIQTKAFTEKADECLTKAGSVRIQLHNEITKAMLRTMDASKDTSTLVSLKLEVKAILDMCIKNQYANSVIRANLLLSVLCFLTNADATDIKDAQRYLKQGINASIQYGIGTYMWQFYNLMAIIAIHQNASPDQQMRLFETVFLQLRRQGILYVASSDFCYGNLLAISNIAGFYAQHRFESEFYQKMGEISYMASPDVCDYNCNKRECNYTCAQSMERLKTELERFQQAYVAGRPLPLPFQNATPTYPLWDEKSKCYVIMS